MSNLFTRSLRALLIGSLVVLSVACRSTDDRSNTMGTQTPPSETARGVDPTPHSTPTNPSVTDPSITDMNRDERMPVAGRDDAIELGAGGSKGAGGSSGTGGSHH